MLTHRSRDRTTISMLFTLCFCAVLKTPAILLLDLPARCGNEGAAAHSLQTPGSCSLAEIGGAPDRKWRRNRMHQRSSCELTRKQHVMVATCACAIHLITVSEAAEMLHDEGCFFQRPLGHSQRRRQESKLL